MNFSQRIADLLVETHHNQAELARFVGVKPNTVSDWINKGTSPKIEHLYRIADFFSISFDYLFTGEKTASSNEINLMNGNETTMMNLFRMLSEKEQDRIIGRLENMVEESQKFKNKEVI